jgi:hypothetical protein
MHLANLTFIKMHPSWDSAMRLSKLWIPELSGSIESRLMIYEGRRVLAAFALHARENGSANMEGVRQLITLERNIPGIVFDQLSLCSDSNAKGVAMSALHSRCNKQNAYEPVLFLDLNIRDDRAGTVAMRWPAGW